MNLKTGYTDNEMQYSPGNEETKTTCMRENLTNIILSEKKDKRVHTI